MGNTRDAAEGSAAPTGYPFCRSPSEVRVQWMRIFGVPEDEIIQSLRDDPPVDIGDEERQLDTLVSIRESHGSGDVFTEVPTCPECGKQYRCRMESRGFACSCGVTFYSDLTAYRNSVR